MNNDLTTLADRLDRMEEEGRRLRRSNTRWRRACMGALLAATTLVFVGWKSDKVTAESIRLVSEGKLRGMLSVTSKGTAALTLMNADQKPRAMLTVSAEGIPKLAFFKNEGKTIRATLGGTPSGNLALVISDPNGQERASLGVSGEGEGWLTVKDAAGNAKK